MAGAFVGKNLENQKEVTYNLNNLTQHAAVLGTTGSGKTVMCKVLIEEALSSGVSVIAIDPKGDIGGLGILSKTFDFRPFVQDAEKTQKAYLSNFDKSKLAGLEKLSKTNTRIYTPKSSIGLSINLIPELSCPQKFKEIYDKDPTLATLMIEPLAESICNLAEIKSNKEKAKSLLSSIILQNWLNNTNLTLETLIAQIITPQFQNVGTLSLEDFLKDTERKKIASSVNLILSSPSKQAWKSKNNLGIEKMYAPSNLSVFDLRYTGSTLDKQYAVEQILDKIYRFLLHKGGSEKLKYILYIDEIAELFPAPPSNPPCKKILETLIRQARAFGLGIILATQNPGDIDYKVLGNIGTRFIGKLRTDNDVEKVSTAIGLSPSTLKHALLNFNAGDFFYNNSVENKSLKIHSRWLYSYHSGPLNEKEIGWVNFPNSRPKQTSELKLPKISETKPQIKPLPKSYSSKVLKKLKEQAEKYSNTTGIFTLTKNASKYKAFLSVTIEPKPFKGKTFSAIGPFVYELSAKNSKSSLPKNMAWKKIAKFNYDVLSAKRSVKKLISQSIKESQRALKKKIYTSKVVGGVEEKRGKVVELNFGFMKEDLEYSKKLLLEKSKRREEKISKSLKVTNKKIDYLRTSLLRINSKRFIRKLLGNKRLAEKTNKIHALEKKIRELKIKGQQIRNKIKKLREETIDQLNQLKSKTHQKSQSLTKGFVYNPTRKSLIVKTKILLVPVEKE